MLAAAARTVVGDLSPVLVVLVVAFDVRLAGWLMVYCFCCRRYSYQSMEINIAHNPADMEARVVIALSYLGGGSEWCCWRLDWIGTTSGLRTCGLRVARRVLCIWKFVFNSALEINDLYDD